MSRAAWPTGTALRDFLAGANIVASPPAGDALLIDYDGAADAALERFEDQTGYHPFMAAAADATLYYTPDRTDVLDLEGGVAAALTSLTVGYSPTSTGTALTVNEDYWLMPLNAIVEGRAANYIRFGAVQHGLPRSIVVVGKFGFCANAAIPEAAYQTVLYLAALEVAPQVQAMLSSGGLTKLTEGDVTYEYGAGALIETWNRRARSGVMQFKRLVVR
jgi:hypothetical protein